MGSLNKEVVPASTRHSIEESSIAKLLPSIKEARSGVTAAVNVTRPLKIYETSVAATFSNSNQSFENNERFKK